MKKSHLVTGILYVLAGIVCLIAALITESKLDGILFGLTGACAGPGLAMICKYYYWGAPKRREVYERRLAEKKVEMHDELKTALRDKSGRYAYLLGLLVICAAMIVFSVLGSLEVLANARMIVLFLGAYLVFQIVAGTVIFNRLLRKY